jgi:hypothetical protein
VDVAGHDLLADATFARDEDLRIGAGDALDFLLKRNDSATHAENWMLVLTRAGVGGAVTGCAVYNCIHH